MEGRDFNLPCLFSNLHLLAVTTGLEPATSALTGQRSNRLSYATIPLCSGTATGAGDEPRGAWWAKQGSNL